MQAVGNEGRGGITLWIYEECSLTCAPRKNQGQKAGADGKADDGPVLLVPAGKQHGTFSCMRPGSCHRCEEAGVRLGDMKLV